MTFDSLDECAALCDQAGVTRWRFPDPIHAELLERESEFAQIAAGHANLEGVESDAQNFAVSLALQVCEREVAVWQDEESAVLQRKRARSPPSYLAKRRAPFALSRSKPSWMSPAAASFTAR